VVAEEEDQRVLFEAAVTQLLEDHADGVVHRALHRDVGAAAFVLDVSEPLEVCVRRLHRDVDGVER
jgi:uncharacterized membrane-anchored protein